MFKTYKALFKDGEEADLLWDGRDDCCFEIINYEWDHLFNILNKTVENTRNVIQAGGNCGLYPLRLSQYFERVFTFEPDPMNFFCLSTNCKNNKIVKFNAAIGDRCEFLMIGNQQENNNGMPRILDADEEGHIIYSITIDSLQLKNVDLVMLDVEGYEYNALCGCEKTLTENNPVVMVEVTKNEKEIDSFLTSLKYELVAKLEGNTTTLTYKK